MIIKIKQAITNIHIHRDTIHNNKIWIKVAPKKTKNETKRKETGKIFVRFRFCSVCCLNSFFGFRSRKKKKKKILISHKWSIFPLSLFEWCLFFFFRSNIVFFLERWVGGGKRIQNSFHFLWSNDRFPFI